MASLREYIAAPEKWLSRQFGRWGYFVASHAWFFILTTGCIGSFSSIGLYWLNTEKDIDVFDIYFPYDGSVTKGLKKMRQDFPDTSDTNYFPWQDNGEYLTLSVLIWNLTSDDILNDAVKEDVKKICDFVVNFQALDPEGATVTYEDACAVNGHANIGGLQRGNDCLLPQLCELVDDSPYAHTGVKWDKNEVTYKDESILAMLSNPVYSVENQQLVRVSEGGKSARIIFHLKKATEEQKQMTLILFGSFSNQLSQSLIDFLTKYT